MKSHDFSEKINQASCTGKHSSISNSKGTCDLPMSFKLQAIAIRQGFNFRGYIKYKTLHTQTTLNAAIFAC